MFEISEKIFFIAKGCSFVLAFAINLVHLGICISLVLDFVKAAWFQKCTLSLLNHSLHKTGETKYLQKHSLRGVPRKKVFRKYAANSHCGTGVLL